VNNWLAQYEKKAFRTAVAAAVGLHLLVILGFLVAGSFSSEDKYQPLAVMDFAYYDPEGGTPGGGEGEEPSTGPVLGPGEPMPIGESQETPEEIQEIPMEPVPATSLVEIPPEPEPEAEPEAATEEEPTELPEVVTSTSEEAAPIPAPPAEKEPEPEPKPKPKPKPKPPAAPKPAPPPQSATEGGAGGGALLGEPKAGGGVGDGRGGVGGGTGIGNPNALNAYAAKIRAKLNRFKKYPPAAVAGRIGGVVTMNFTVNRQGEVISSRMVKSSGQPILDQEAIALVKRCSPFPPMPNELPQSTLNLTVPINFNPPQM
jgi:protein TonB